ncbi:MAG: hypothetical protein U0930_10755 [Pirellulales bacterium]
MSTAAQFVCQDRFAMDVPQAQSISDRRNGSRCQDRSNDGGKRYDAIDIELCLHAYDNDVDRDSVAVYRRAQDGSLAQVIGSPFSAGGNGLTGGDIDGLRLIRVVGKYVLAVNQEAIPLPFLKKLNAACCVEGSPFHQWLDSLSLAVHGDLVALPTKLRIL